MILFSERMLGEARYHQLQPPWKTDGESSFYYISTQLLAQVLLEYYTSFNLVVLLLRLLQMVTVIAPVCSRFSP